MKIKKSLIAVLAVTTMGLNAGSCGSPSNFFKVIKDTCYSCMFPMYIAGVPLGSAPVNDASDKVRQPLCLCGSPIPRIGIPIGYWNPNRFIETVKDPWCFPLLGVSIPIGFGSLQRGARTYNHHRTFMQSHYYIYPIFYMLELFTDFACMTSTSYDLAYPTEVDPLWDDDELAFWISPESILFANPLAQLACVGDAVKANINNPVTALFWCKGSWGGLYPITGNVAQENIVEDAASVASNMIFKLMREMLLLNGAGVSALCGKHSQPIWNKNNFRLQLMLPQSNKECTVIGKDALFWSAFKNLPGKGMDQFGYLLFQKRDCCMF
jgi:conjugal transfer pilus assembly protein TraU